MPIFLGFSGYFFESVLHKQLANGYSASVFFWMELLVRKWKASVGRVLGMEFFSGLYSCEINSASSVL